MITFNLQLNLQNKYLILYLLNKQFDKNWAFYFSPSNNLSKYSIVFFKPSFLWNCGFHPSSFLANLMSGHLCFGSSIGRSLLIICDLLLTFNLSSGGIIDTAGYRYYHDMDNEHDGSKLRMYVGKKFYNSKTVAMSEEYKLLK